MREIQQTRGYFDEKQLRGVYVENTPLNLKLLECLNRFRYIRCLPMSIITYKPDTNLLVFGTDRPGKQLFHDVRKVLLDDYAFFRDEFCLSPEERQKELRAFRRVVGRLAAQSIHRVKRK